MIDSYEEFKAFYEERGRFPDGSYVRPKGYNETQLRSKYDKYVKALEKAEQRVQRQRDRIVEKNDMTSEVDEQWQEMRAQVFARDSYRCRLLDKLNPTELAVLKHKSGGLHKILDPAHVFRVSMYPGIKYDSRFVVVLNRYSHSMLDQYRHPVMGDSMDREDIEAWWRYICPEYDALMCLLP